MAATLAIYLRDLSKEPCEFLVEVEDSDNVEEDPASEVIDTRALFDKFVAATEDLLRSRPELANVDVYISYYAIQGDICPSKEFFDLISRQSWEVTIDFNS